MSIYTIGFTQKKAAQFFALLRQAQIERLVDVRLNNLSQLAGFAKRDDLEFFLRELCSAEYLHMPDLAPTREMLDAYKKKHILWKQYEDQFLNLMARRNIERSVKPELLDRGCLLCSEHKPHHCHRRLVADYLNQHWNTQINVIHLV